MVCGGGKPAARRAMYRDWGYGVSMTGRGLPVASLKLSQVEVDGVQGQGKCGGCAPTAHVLIRGELCNVRPVRLWESN